MTFFALSRRFRINAALLLAAAAAPVQAAGFEAPPAAQVRQGSQAAQAERTICRNVTAPGSRVSRKVCRTRSEWDRESQAGADEVDRRVDTRSNY